MTALAANWSIRSIIFVGLDAAGRGALLLNDMRIHVRALAEKRGVLSLHRDPDHCSICRDFREHGETEAGLDPTLRVEVRTD